MSSKAEYRLSDGTPATVGRIVVVITGKLSGHSAGEITKILGDFQEEDGEIHCRCLWGVRDNLWESLSDLRAATPEEKKKWRAWLRTQPMWRAVP